MVLTGVSYVFDCKLLQEGSHLSLLLWPQQPSGPRHSFRVGVNGRSRGSFLKLTLKCRFASPTIKPQSFRKADLRREWCGSSKSVVASFDLNYEHFVLHINAAAR